MSHKEFLILWCEMTVALPWIVAEEYSDRIIIISQCIVEKVYRQLKFLFK